MKQSSYRPCVRQCLMVVCVCQWLTRTRRVTSHSVQFRSRESEVVSETSLQNLLHQDKTCRRFYNFKSKFKKGNEPKSPILPFLLLFLFPFPHESFLVQNCCEFYDSSLRIPNVGIKPSCCLQIISWVIRPRRDGLPRTATRWSGKFGKFSRSLERSQDARWVAVNRRKLIIHLRWAHMVAMASAPSDPLCSLELDLH